MKKIAFLFLILTFLLISPVWAEDNVHIKYSPHIENKGWMDYVYDGETAGTTGSNLRCEALKIFVVNDKGDPLTNLGIKYRSHIQDYGWQNYVTNGQTSGTTQQQKKIEAVQLSLFGDLSGQYDIYYRSHIENYGWLSWAKNGDPSGSEGYNYRLEAIQIKVLPKSASETPEIKDDAFKSHYGVGDLRYRSHIQNIGWSDYVSDGEVSGTTGKNLKLEALTISPRPGLPEGDIECSAHIQNIGWSDYQSCNHDIGTTGKNLRIEALKIRLTGDLSKTYDIFYQVHVEDYGWCDPVSNNEIAGTTGECKKIEAIRIELLKKGSGEKFDPVIDPSKCSHPNTVIKNNINPSCIAEGYTGDTYCTVCYTQVASGTIIPKIDHSYQEIPITLASKAGPGVSRFICQVCNFSIDKPVDYNPTPEQVYRDIIALKLQYPEDMPWTNDNKYTSTALNQIGSGCHAFALLCSDAAFGYLPGRKHYDVTKLKVGDLVRIHNDNHTAVILEIKPNSVIITEGNYNADIHWGREIQRKDLDPDISYIITRYPE